MLRVEMMDRGVWWWAVYDHEGRPRCHQLAASYEQPPYHARTGKIARAECEKAARKILKSDTLGQARPRSRDTRN